VDILGRFDTKPDAVAADAEDRDADVVVDHDHFKSSAAQNKHCSWLLAL
jgi:hypothetical protein